MLGIPGPQKDFSVERYPILSLISGTDSKTKFKYSHSNFDVGAKFLWPPSVPKTVCEI